VPKILFIPSLLYLSNPIFKRIVSEIRAISPDVFCSYLDTDYRSHQKHTPSIEQTYQELRSDFDEVDFMDISIEYHSFNAAELIVLRKNIQLVLRKIEAINPDIIVVATDYTIIYKLINHHFKHKKLFTVQQGIMHHTPRTNYTLREKLTHECVKQLTGYPIFKYSPWMEPMDYTKHLSWSKFFHANPFANYKVTGNPYWDPLFQTEQLPANQARKKIVIATQPIGEVIGKDNALAFWQDIASSINTLDNQEIIIKVHPRESAAYYESLFPKNSSNTITVTGSTPLTELFKEARFFFTAWSSTIYDSIFSHVPSYILNPSNRIDVSSKFISHHIPCITQASEMTEIFREEQYEAILNQFTSIRKMVGIEINTYMDGLSAKRAAQSILSIT
jgi:hypothetical protein